MKHQELLSYFESYLRYERQFSDHTVTSYLSDCKDFLKFLNESGDDQLLQVTYADARIYLSYLTDQSYERSSISRKISSLRALYYFIVQNGEMDHNPFARLKMKGPAKALPHFFYEEEMEELFKSCQGNRPLDYRNRALLEVLYATGIRVSECVQLKKEELDLDLSLLLVHGKGKKDRYVPFGAHAADALIDYYQAGRQVLMDRYHKDHDVVFVNHHGDPLTPQGISYILDQLVQSSALTASIHPHKIRHSFASHLLNRGADIRSVQELLGHSSLSSTQVYTHVTKEHLQNQYNTYFSRS